MSEEGRLTNPLPLEDQGEEAAGGDTGSGLPQQREFFDFPGPLYSVVIPPASCAVPVGQSRNLRAIRRDRKRKPVEENLVFTWDVVEGGGELTETGSEISTL